MAFRGFRRLVGALALVWAFGGGAAQAATIYTYNFSQDFTFPETGRPVRTVTGGFSGTVDSFGYINLGTLTDFHFSIPLGMGPGSYSGLPSYFSFQMGDTSGSTLAFQSPADFFGARVFNVCVGAAVAILCNGGIHRGYWETVSAGARTFGSSDTAPVVTLVATTPIPGALLLLATALGGLGAMGFRHRLRAED